MKAPFIASLWLAFVVLITSCHQPSPIGNEILPGSQIFSSVFTDTFSLSGKVERDDSLITSLQTTFLLGSMSDPTTFGNAYAGIFTQLKLSAAQTPGGSLTLDSAVLVLHDSGPAYGDEATTHDISVFRVTENMVFGKDYFASNSFPYDPLEIGRLEDYLPNDSFDIRIPLDRSFGEMMLAESQTSTFESNAEFQSFFKGIYIAPDTSSSHSNSMLLIDLLDPLSTISLYYRDSDNDTLIYSFVINATCATQNHIVHNYTGTQAAVALADSAADDLETLLEGSNGLRIRVRLPDLSSLGEIAINKAELVLTVIDDTVYASATTMLPRLLNESGGLEATVDEALGSLTSAYDVGGTLVIETEGSTTYKRYRINLAKHLYLLSRGEIEDDEIIIQIVPPSQTPARVRIGGAGNADPNLRMKLNLVYTRLI